MADQQNIDLQFFGPLRYAAGLAYRATGSGRSLVLLHGGSGSRTHWARNIEALARHFRVLSIDLPGFGESAAPPQSFDADDYIDWVADSLERALGDDSFDLVGFSFGGVVAAATAARLAQRQRKPGRLSLVSPAGWGTPEGREIRLEKVPRGPDADPQHIREVTARNLGRWMLSREPAAQDPAVDIHLENVARTRYDSRQISHRNTLLEDLRKAEVDMQFLLGADDPLAWPSPAQRAQVLRSSFPQAPVHLVEGAGHWLQYEAFTTINEQLIKFHMGDRHGI